MRSAVLLLSLTVAGTALAQGSTQELLWKEVSGGDSARVQAALTTCAATGDCDLDRRDSRGSTLLHRAVLLQHAEVTRLLLEAGASVDAQDGQGRTPLHDSVSSGQREVAEVLLAWDADPGAEDAAGLSPLGMAEISGRKSLAELLRQHEKKGLRIRWDPRIVGTAMMTLAFVAGVAGFACRRQRRQNLKVHGSEYADAGFSVWLQDRPDHPLKRADLHGATAPASPVPDIVASLESDRR